MKAFDPSRFFAHMRFRFETRVVNDGVCYSDPAKPLRNSGQLLRVGSVQSDISEYVKSLDLNELLCVLLLWRKHVMSLRYEQAELESFEINLSTIFERALKSVSSWDEIMMVHYLWNRQTHCEPARVPWIMMEVFLCRVVIDVGRWPSKVRRSVRQVLGHKLLEFDNSGLSAHIGYRTEQLESPWSFA